MKARVASLEERREFSHAELDGLKARLGRYEAALRLVLTDPRITKATFDLVTEALKK